MSGVQLVGGSVLTIHLGQCFPVVLWTLMMKLGSNSQNTVGRTPGHHEGWAATQLWRRICQSVHVLWASTCSDCLILWDTQEQSTCRQCSFCPVFTNQGLCQLCSAWHPQWAPSQESPSLLVVIIIFLVGLWTWFRTSFLQHYCLLPG